jgi:hypothetical protein
MRETGFVCAKALTTHGVPHQWPTPVASAKIEQGLEYV